MDKIDGTGIVYLGQHSGQHHTMGGSEDEMRMLRQVLQSGWTLVKLDSGIAFFKEGFGYQTLRSAFKTTQS